MDDWFCVGCHYLKQYPHNKYCTLHDDYCVFIKWCKDYATTSELLLQTDTFK